MGGHPPARWRSRKLLPGLPGTWEYAMTGRKEEDQVTGMRGGATRPRAGARGQAMITGRSV
jgi:hypothetical protein